MLRKYTSVWENIEKKLKIITKVVVSKVQSVKLEIKNKLVYEYLGDYKAVWKTVRKDTPKVLKFKEMR